MSIRTKHPFPTRFTKEGIKLSQWY